MAFETQRILHITLLFVAWACMMARTGLLLVPQRGRDERLWRAVPVWTWAVTVAGLILYLALRLFNSRLCDLLDSHDHFVALCAGYILALRHIPRESDRTMGARVAWGVAVTLIGIAAVWGVGEAGAIERPFHLGSSLYVLSDVVLSAAVGTLAFVVVSEWTRLRRASADQAVDIPPSLSVAVMTWAMIAAWTALLLGAVGTFLAEGALWSWDPVELWRLSLALLYALLVHGRRPRTPGLRRAIAYLVALAFSLFILFGVRSLVRVLGLPSRFIS